MIENREAIFNSFRNIGFKDGKPADEKLLLNHSTCKGETGDLVILIGANNSGKSNILDGLKFYDKRRRFYDCQEIERCKEEIKKSESYQKFLKSYQTTLYSNEECRNPEVEVFISSKKEVIDKVSFKINGEYIKNKELSSYYYSDFWQEVCKKCISLWESFCAKNGISYRELYIRNYSYSSNFLSLILEYNYDTDIEDKYKKLQRYFLSLFFNKYLTQTISDVDFINTYCGVYWNEPKVLDDTEVKHIESSDLEISPDGLEESYFFLSLLHSINMDKQDVISAYENMQRDKQRKYLDELQKQINNKLEDISSIFNQLYVTKDVTYSFKVEFDRKSILFIIYRNKDVMVLDNQSKGFRYFFDLFFYLQSGQLSAGDIFVMDEPAIRLHSSAKREFRVFLKKIARHHDITMVLATHSSSLIDLNYLDELRIIENKDNIVRIHNTFTAVNYGDPDSLLPIKKL